MNILFLPKGCVFQTVALALTKVWFTIAAKILGSWDLSVLQQLCNSEPQNISDLSVLHLALRRLSAVLENLLLNVVVGM